MRILILSLYLCISLSLFGQLQSGQSGPYPPVSLSSQDSTFLCLIPPLKIPELYLGSNAPQLPGSLDNSTQPFFRGVFQQEQYSCGQASSVGYAFTYEINRARNLPANIDENRYPTHFVWNWMNGGNGWYGVSYYHTFQILRKVGTPSVEAYGGMATGGPSRWINGYDNYYEGMKNRIHNAYAINTSTVEGITYLKHWLHDHMEGSDVGGVANFYANHPQLYNLPSGTPQAGRKVAISFSSSSHAMTIVGYNDSICWDYNGDGQYTNDMDITGDGIVDVKDWEIGGFLMVNSYGGVPNWGDQGFCYMMYRSLAMPYGNGGIWNNTVNVQDVKASCNPQLTYKLAVKHLRRDKIRVVAGVSTDPAATEPDFEISFPIVDYQGGNFYMQGGSSEEDKTLEFGLDVSELLNYVEPGQDARYFFSVYENDPSGTHTGEIVSFSLMNYTSGVNEIPSGFSNIPIENNAKTTVFCNAAINFNDVDITSDGLKPVDIGLPYADTLEAAGGEAPYIWSKYFPYEATATANALPMIDDEELSVSGANSGYAEKTLDFSFPFYDNEYETIYVSADGFLFFKLQNYPWPYMHDPKMMIRGYRKIAPFDADLTLSGGGVWYEGNDQYAIFRWEAYRQNSDLLTDYNFGVKLYANGDIEFLYGDNITTSVPEWYAGISDGDYANYEIIMSFDEDEIPVNEGIYISAPDFVPQLSISEEGYVEGNIDNDVEGLLLNVAVTDNNHLRDVKAFPVNIQGLLATTSATAGNDSIIEFGESVLLDLDVQNFSDFTYHQAEITIHCDSPFVTLTDSTETLGTLLAHQLNTVEDAFAFDVDVNVPDGHELTFYGEITSDYDPYPVSFTHTAYAPVLFVSSVLFDSPDGTINAGDTATMELLLENSGGAGLHNLTGVITNNDPYVSITAIQNTLSSLNRHTVDTMTFECIVRESAVQGHLDLSLLNITTQEGIEVNDSVFFNVGGVFEGFETGNFSQMPWQFAGDRDWETHATTTYEGEWSARNKTITHNQYSEMYLDLDILSGGAVTFYRKVSSENNYDFLRFFVNGAEMGAWSGEKDWEKRSYPVGKGEQKLRWMYQKDYSEDGGQDCGWVDNISFPASVLLENSVNCGQNFMLCEGESAEINATAVNCAAVEWSTAGDGSFSDISDVETLYTPGPQDIEMQGVVLTLTSYPAFGSPESDDVNLGIYPVPEVFAGNDTAVCINGILPLLHASASYFTSVMWETSGDGYFDDPGSINCFYYPGNEDYSNGQVELILTAYGHPDCDASSQDGFTLSFNPLPEADAGEDTSTPFGTYVTLYGDVTGGSGDYSWHWSPEENFVDPDLQEVQSVNLEASFIATLLVTDNVTGCSGTDDVTVTVTGGELYISATAEPENICVGEEVQLMALPGGGTGDYTFIWSSEPSGFEANEPAPLASPETTTTYFVEVNDGFNTASAEVTVTVNLLPEPDLGEDLVVCIYNTATLDAGEFESYLWSTGETTRTIEVDSTGIGMASAEFIVTVTNETGCMESDSIIVTFDPCTGIENMKEDEITVWPVPADDMLHIAGNDLSGALEYVIYNLTGAILQSGKTENSMLNVGALKPGCYMLETRDRNGVKAVTKFVILR